MRAITINGFRRISKADARKRYNNGEMIRLCPVKFRPDNMAGFFGDIYKDSRLTEQDGFQTVVSRKDFDDTVRMFEYYNCQDSRSGYYAAFYVKE